MARKRPFTPEELEARRLKQKEYNSRPEVIERRKEYYRRPEVQARYLARREAGAQTEYLKQWRSSEHGKRVLKIHSLNRAIYMPTIVIVVKSLEDCFVRHAITQKVRFVRRGYHLKNSGGG